MMRTLVVGASGATGRLLVADLLGRENQVTTIVRESSSLKASFGDDPNYREVCAGISDIPDNELVAVVRDCDAVLSCLGHNLSLRGMFGEPRRLVTRSLQKLCRAIETAQPDRKVKVILMNSSGNSNRDIPEVPPWSQRAVISLLRLTLPPHVDNEQAADFLRTGIGRDHACIEWVVVRPDGLVDEDQVSGYALYPSPIRNAIFDAGSVSRINVANFMARLANDSALWELWQGQMPVIYSEDDG